MFDDLPPDPPERHRHDGWTPQRQQDFLEALAHSGSVQEACASVGKSRTSAYKARYRIRGFRNRWDDALARIQPTVEFELRRRAIDGYDEPVFQGGKQVGVRRRYSDSLLRLMVHRDTRPPEGQVKIVPIEEVEAEVLRLLALTGAADKRKRAEEAVAEAERMRAAGLCP